jgi:hypothetical protein
MAEVLAKSLIVLTVTDNYVASFAHQPLFEVEMLCSPPGRFSYFQMHAF